MISKHCVISCPILSQWTYISLSPISPFCWLGNVLLRCTVNSTTSFFHLDLLQQVCLLLLYHHGLSLAQVCQRIHTHDIGSNYPKNWVIETHKKLMELFLFFFEELNSHVASAPTKCENWNTNIATQIVPHSLGTSVVTCNRLPLLLGCHDVCL
jgi:hypothetical protein